MPTGYTADVQSGKITEFTDFAWRCARGMGALVTMRDEAWDAPIPERFEPHTAYHDEALNKATARLAELRAMSPLAIREAAQQDYADSVRSEDAYQVEKATQRARYLDMLAKVEAWTPPTDEHKGFREFMASQLRESIGFDCPEGPSWKPPRKLEPDAWFAEQTAKCEHDISYHTKARADEVARTESRNSWLAELRASLTPEA